MLLAKIFLIIMYTLPAHVELLIRLRNSFISTIRFFEDKCRDCDQNGSKMIEILTEVTNIAQYKELINILGRKNEARKSPVAISLNLLFYLTLMSMNVYHPDMSFDDDEFFKRFKTFVINHSTKNWPKVLRGLTDPELSKSAKLEVGILRNTFNIMIIMRKVNKIFRLGESVDIASLLLENKTYENGGGATPPTLRRKHVFYMVEEMISKSDARQLTFSTEEAPFIDIMYNMKCNQLDNCLDYQKDSISFDKLNNLFGMEPINVTFPDDRVRRRRRGRPEAASIEDATTDDVRSTEMRIVRVKTENPPQFHHWDNNGFDPDSDFDDSISNIFNTHVVENFEAMPNSFAGYEANQHHPHQYQYHQYHQYQHHQYHQYQQQHHEYHAYSDFQYNDSSDQIVNFGDDNLFYFEPEIINSFTMADAEFMSVLLE